MVHGPKLVEKRNLPALAQTFKGKQTLKNASLRASMQAIPSKIAPLRASGDDRNSSSDHADGRSKRPYYDNYQTLKAK